MMAVFKSSFKQSMIVFGISVIYFLFYMVDMIFSHNTNMGLQNTVLMFLVFPLFIL
ncbi:hypothetical protein N644_2116 [Lactiplantibacillus paraplantarum]|uniref:Uncharacterized protein n=1 Tax=Lactiplantibacillus paraplantarum TaxID=60520 RepID=A0ABQ0NEN1_9LACO|nr:hypothetical protein N644_2116 [Lactiplantibacillus paraplantarum]KRL47747.1 hypothetical protein FD48_GL001683 [Lactiplantibacillus paraplantarum DSM 10667]QJU51402.1 hypothetical protein CK401_02311 [Lactiplantibacillus paraplantarum]GBF02912.1 hypothetical protein LPPLD21_02464 [Lactiplantibacillus paraplantarum]GEO62044.1 hypothetical protein LPA07_23650 [Lactiplantibacillus paraplantarum]